MENLSKTLFVVIGMTGVIGLAFVGVQYGLKPKPDLVIPTTELVPVTPITKTDLAIPSIFLITGEEIVITPPGSRASASTLIVGESYGWFLWEFDTTIRPGKFETVEEGKRINFEAKKGSSYAISLLVNPGLQTYQTVWEYEVPDDPPPDDPPQPPLTEFAQVAYDLALKMGPEAKAEAKKVGNNYQFVGAKLSANAYPGASWEEKTTAALRDRAQLDGAIHSDWIKWKTDWGTEIDARLNDGRIKQDIQSVGQALIETSKGLVRVK